MRKVDNYISSYLVNVLSYFIILLPIFLISGPFLSDLSVSILAISSFFFLRDKKFFQNYIFLFFCIFWLVTIISSIFSENIVLSFKSSSLYFRFFLFSLIVWWYLENNNKILKKIFIVLLICFLILIFDSIFQYLTGSNVLGMKPISEDRISSFFGDELKMGGYLMRLFPLLVALGFFFYKKKKHEKYLYIAIIFIAFVQITIFLSGERTSFILFNFSILLFLLFLNDFKKIKILFFLIYTIVLFLVLNIETPFKKRMIDLTLNQAHITKEGKPRYIFSKQYHEHYFSAWKMFMDNKLIGIGPKNYREKCKEEKYNFSKLTCSNHPHNIPLQILAETGILGFFIYLLLNLVIWFNLIKSLFSKIINKKKYLNNFQISLFICIAILIWPITPNGNIFNNWLSIIFYFPVGFLLWEFRRSKKIYLKAKKK